MNFMDDGYRRIYDKWKRAHRRRAVIGNSAAALAPLVPGIALIHHTQWSPWSIVIAVVAVSVSVAIHAALLSSHWEITRSYLTVLDQRDDAYRQRTNAVKELHALAEEHGVTTIEKVRRDMIEREQREHHE